MVITTMVLESTAPTMKDDNGDDNNDDNTNNNQT